MRYDDPKLRQQLAGAYALGSLQGPARARFERLMENDAELRRLVVDYQEDLMPLVLDAPEVRPPARIRQQLVDATTPNNTGENESKESWWHQLSFWRGLATANGLLTVALVAFVGVGVGVLQDTPPSPSELVYVGVLSDADEKPGVTVLAYNNPFRLEIASKTALTSPPRSELRLWIKNRETGLPMFLTAIPANDNVFTLDDQAWKLLSQAESLMITRETIDSETTAPGEDVLYEGVCVNLKKWSDKGSES